NVAPGTPSRPVSAPTSSRGLPTPEALARITLSERSKPTHMALTIGLPVKEGSKPISPPTVGTPRQLPYPPMPTTTPPNKYLLRGSDSGPKRRELSSATGRAPIVKISRTMPPTPVAAPSTGSTAEGWLCDSILSAAAHPSPRSTTPAFSPGPCSTRGPLVGNLLRRGLECL